MSANSFDAKGTLRVGGRELEIFRLDALQAKYDVARLPFSLKVLLENLLRNEDGPVTADDIAGSRAGTRRPTRPRDRLRPAACCCRTSPAFPPWSTWPRCATR